MAELYDFQNLSFDDFERLCADLLERRLGVRLESFKVGKDDGIDLRHAASPNDTIIVQCKRYAPGAFNRLLRDMRDSELEKIKALAPRRYVVCTSCDLSPSQKDKLLTLLAGYCLSTDDILGSGELNRAIASDENIERRHFKLWMSSTAVLQRILHAGIFAYSEHEVARLREKISRYVVHDGFFRALELLERNHHCVILGIPGIGKTTAARLLLAHYLRDGYEVISASHDIEEAWKALERDANARVVVYYDDFLGQMTLSHKLAKNEDKRLLAMIALCRNSTHKRFILTTRDYVFDQALNAYEPLGQAQNELERSSVKLDDYGPMVRARLLANHLQFSSIGIATLRELIRSRAYVSIVEHQNFLPRIIEQICDSKSVPILKPREFVANALALLDDPARVWRQPFEQLSIEARHALYVLASFDGEGELSRLELAWRAMCRGCGHRTYRLFRDVLREIEGSFTRSQRFGTNAAAAGSAGTIIAFLNPSAREYVVTDLVSKDDLLGTVFAVAISFDQLLFWREVRKTFVERDPEIIVAAFGGEIADAAIRLLSVAEPEVGWVGFERVILWQPPVNRMTRLHQLFESFHRLDRADCLEKVVTSLFIHDLNAFSILLRSGDLTWAPEVLQEIIDVLGRDDPSFAARARELLNIDEWSGLPADLPEVRYVWQMLEKLLPGRQAYGHESEEVRLALAERASQLCEKMPTNMAADELSEAVSEMQLLTDDLRVDIANEMLQKIREREALARSAEEDQKSEEDESVESVVIESYRPAHERLETDRAALFNALLDQLTFNDGEVEDEFLDVDKV